MATTSDGSQRCIYIPSQAQLRYMSTILTPSQLYKLKLFQPTPSTHSTSLESASPSSCPSPDEIFTAFRQAEGDTRDKIWTLAIEDKYQLPTSEICTSSTFHQFQSLPFELRDKIWKHALESDRLLEIAYSENSGWSVTKSSQVRRAPAMMYACRESHTVTKIVMFYCFGTWINSRTDTVWISSPPKIFSMIHVDYFLEDLHRALHKRETYRRRYWHMEKNIEKNYWFGRLAVSWKLWKYVLKYESNHPVLFGGEFGDLRRWFPRVTELVLIRREKVKSPTGFLYSDRRVLTENDLLDESLAEKFEFPKDVEEKVLKYLEFDQGQFTVSKRMLNTGW